jgi:hypothetical protein
MDEMKWAWVLFVAATLALLIRLSTWLVPAPGWRDAKVKQATETAETAAVSEAMPEIAAAPLPPPPEPIPVPPPAPAPAVEPIPRAPAPPPAPPPDPPPEEYHLRRVRWGMAPEDVRAAEPGAPLRGDGSALAYATTTLDLPCLLTYSFAEGRLARARMAFSDPTGTDIPPLSVAQAQRRFLYLREQLRSRYGEPVQKTVHVPRDSAQLERTAQKQDELAKQYDAEIAEAERRLKQERERLERRFQRWKNPAEMVARGLAPYERDLRDLRKWKQEALDLAGQSRKGIQERREADARAPLVAVMTARWPGAQELHDVELVLDLRARTPRLEVRYESMRGAPRRIRHAL